MMYLVLTCSFLLARCLFVLLRVRLCCLILFGSWAMVMFNILVVYGWVLARCCSGLIGGVGCGFGGGLVALEFASCDLMLVVIVVVALCLVLLVCCMLYLLLFGFGLHGFGCFAVYLRLVVVLLCWCA